VPGIVLPSALQRAFESLLQDLLRPAGSPTFEFSSPPGEPALVPANSVAWRVFSNPLTLFIGGVAAVILELAEPRVRHGVWDHSSFRQNPLDRLKRTGLAAMVSVYGPETAARAMIAHVVRVHQGISGITSSGKAYRADDPDLLRWVHATASFGFVEAYRTYGGHLAGAQLDAYYAEVAPIAELYGAHGAPRSEIERRHHFALMGTRLEPSAAISEFLEIMVKVPVLPRLARPAQRMLVAAAIDILPDGILRRLGLLDRRLRTWERPGVAAMGKVAGGLILRSSPAVQSCRRLGLPDDWLYRTHGT
jgi:uncharacterized protein (DUF2236 family)